MPIIHVTKETFPQQVLNADRPVLLDFWATWCGPCRMIAPILEEIAAERPDVQIAKIDVDQELELAAQFKVVSIPTLVLMDGGKEVARSVGYSPKEEILELLGY